MINMEAIPKFDIKSVIKFDISTKPTTWIGHYCYNIYTVKKSRRKRDLKIVSSAKTEAEAVTLH